LAIEREISTFPMVSLRGHRWVRAQRLERAEQLTAERMLPPDPTKIDIPEGRFHHAGQSVLYMSEDVETAIAETFNQPNGLCGIQSFEITSLDRVLDLRGTSSSSILYAALVYDRHLDRPVDHTSSWKPEYLVPRFVADVARRKEFDGIAYRSSKIFYAKGSNVVVFHPSAESCQPCGEPTLQQRNACWTSLGLGDAEFVNYSIEIVPTTSPSSP
jgi:RES domain-containing protein